MRDDILEQANAIRISMNAAGEKFTDNEAVKYETIYEWWKSNIPVKSGIRVRDYNTKNIEKVYKCLMDLESFQNLNHPRDVPNLWAVLEVTATGTIDDPITASRGMEYTYGLYYYDSEDGKIYLCKREGETGTIVLQHLPHELVGNYFEKVTP